MSENESDYKILNIECEGPGSSELHQTNHCVNSEGRMRDTLEELIFPGVILATREVLNLKLCQSYAMILATIIF